MLKSPVLPFYGAIAQSHATHCMAAIFGAPHGTPYPGINNRIHEAAPDAFRIAMKEDSLWIDHWDFDFDGPLLRPGIRVADLGNLATASAAGETNRDLIRNCTRQIRDAGAVPIMFGGDDSVPIPFIEGFAGAGPIHILQIDAHIDWREEREGERFGFSSTMRRASEQPHVRGIVQAGMRGLGSAREGEVKDARAWGAKLVTARDIHHQGTGIVLRDIPDGCDCVISFDCDAIDLSQMPAVSYPTPGGLSYTQVTDLIAGVARKARIAGFTMVEFMPSRDPAGTAAFTAARIAATVIANLKPRA